MRGIEGKVVILGSKGVGKTCLVTKYIKNALHKDVGPNIVASFFTCKVLLDDVTIKLQIWDTAGQERFRAVTPMYYRNANAAILVFDLSQYRTFSDLKVWLKELHRNVQDPVNLTLVGNKLDLTADRAVSHEEATLFATSIGAAYYETSAETDRGLHQVFNSTASGLLRLANEGKTRSLRQFDSCDSILTYSNNNTAFSHSSAAMETHSRGLGRSGADVPIGLAVDGGDEGETKTTGVGRLEMPSWSIQNIAHGEVVHVGWCCM